MPAGGNDLWPGAAAKIATTMGIDHPCGGAIFARTIHTSPAALDSADFVNLRIESEIALELGTDLPALGAPWTRETVPPAVAAAMAAFELIEDRNADYAKVEPIPDGGELLQWRHRDRRAQSPAGR